MKTKPKADVFLKLKIATGKSETAFVSVMSDGFYRVNLKSRPVDGRANAELVRWLSRQFGVDASGVLIKSGVSSRRKTVKIASPSGYPEWYDG